MITKIDGEQSCRAYLLLPGGKDCANRATVQIRVVPTLQFGIASIDRMASCDDHADALEETIRGLPGR